MTIRLVRDMRTIEDGLEYIFLDEEELAVAGLALYESLDQSGWPSVIEYMSVCTWLRRSDVQNDGLWGCVDLFDLMECMGYSRDTSEEWCFRKYLSAKPKFSLLEWQRFRAKYNVIDDLLPRARFREAKRIVRSQSAQEPVAALPPRKRVFSEAEAHEILTKHGQRCYWCGTTERTLVIDHYVPFAKGGPTETWNGVPSCVRCNEEKGAMMPDEYRAKIIERDARGRTAA